MEFEVCYQLDNEQQFWDELDDIVSAQGQTHGLIDDALRSYITFVTSYKGEYLHTEYDIVRCSFKLLESALFSTHKDYIRRQIVFSLLGEDSPDTLHLIVALLLFDGRDNEATFELMNDEGVFPRLIELIQEGKDDDVGLHRMLLELLYEMSRIQRLRAQDLIATDDDFVQYLFQIIEGLSDDVNDPYHYPVIRVLATPSLPQLILNEQYMVSAHDPTPSSQPPTTPTRSLTNRVIKTLSAHGSRYKTFGENIILLLNRESETSLQLLILKLLYLLFTTPATYEYFYTNDLRVLLDIITRNLLDLPLSAAPLRHTYLRVLYPLLAHTQLRNPPHYKRDELLRLLTMMTAVGGASEGHFGAVDETTKRLVGRCVRVGWLGAADDDDSADGRGQGDPARNLLGVEMPGASVSSLSVVEVTTQKERPGVLTGSRRHQEGGEANGKEGGAVGPEQRLDAGEATLALEKSPFEVEGET
ncbi:MAG: hypothetical protein LQ344_000601 [Seirophora lacunosa]|nr:MAG: hypothetical protein LQ344_000601 [Seirophora lacunosa]